MAKLPKPPVPVLTTQQRLNSIRIERLKNLVAVTITFDADKPLTAIMGPNGFGKSTVLHLLASSFRPTSVKKKATITLRGETYQYVNFFPSTPHGSWSNSRAVISHYYRRGKREYIKTCTVSKGIGIWYPIAVSKPFRETYFIGVASALPEIERERLVKAVKYQTQDQIDPQSLELLHKVGHVLNRIYTKSYSNITKKGRSLVGVNYEGVNYSALVMGAGEQRLFHLLKIVIEASDYSLILIDELDLLLHTDALNRLLEVLNEYAQNKKLQIIFTTHRESVTNLRFQNYVAVRHLYQITSPVAKTFCFNDTKPAALDRLTGDTHKKLRISCEDDHAVLIIQKVAKELGLSGRIQYTKFGSASNCFTLAAALVLKEEDLAHSLLVLDGDEQATLKERHKAIDSALSGTEAIAHQRKQKALECIRQFRPDGLYNPEEMLHRAVHNLPLTGNPEIDEVINAARQLTGFHAVKDAAKIRLLKWQEKLGVGTQLERIINVAAQSPIWVNYTKEIRDWLEAQKLHIEEQTIGQ